MLFTHLLVLCYFFFRSSGKGKAGCVVHTPAGVVFSFFSGRQKAVSSLRNEQIIEHPMSNVVLDIFQPHCSLRGSQSAVKHR